MRPDVTRPSEREVVRAIQSALELPDGSITLESSSENVGAWDSFGQVGIVVALDALFEGKVGPIADIADATSVATILRILRENSLL
jgi:acyl carrier protein